MAVLFHDTFTSSSDDFYGRAPDVVNFSTNPTWTESTSSCYTGGGYLRTEGSVWGGMDRVWLQVGDDPTEYLDENGALQTFYPNDDPHEIHIKATRLGGGDAGLVVRITGSNGGYIDERPVTVGAAVGDSVSYLFSVPGSSLTGRYEFDFDVDIGIDYVIITTPGHIFVEPERGKTWTRHLKTIETDA